MRRLRHLACGVALCAAVGASPASAANWDPVGIESTATQVGATLLTTNTNAFVRCTRGDARFAVTSGVPDLLTTTHGIANPVAFSDCDSQGILVVDVTTFGTWELTAVNTTTVNLTATAGGTAPVLTYDVTPLQCDLQVSGPLAILNNTWNNAATTLTINSTTTFALTSDAYGTGSQEQCRTVFGTSARLEGVIGITGATVT